MSLFDHGGDEMGSQSERVFVQDGIHQDIRLDGRRRDDLRPLSLTLGVLNHVAGSAQLRLGGTEVVVAVRCDVDTVTEGNTDWGRLTVSVELADGVATAGGDSAAVADVEADLACALASAFASPSRSGGVCRGEASGGVALDWRTLGVIPGRRAWVLGCDALVLSHDGALLDALSVAIKAALADTVLPELLVTAPGADTAATQGGQSEFELGNAMRHLDVRSVPVIVTVSRIGAHHVLDASEAEAVHADAQLWAAVTPAGDVTASGLTDTRVALPPGAAADMLAAARDTGVALHAALNKYLQSATPVEPKPLIRG